MYFSHIISQFLDFVNRFSEIEKEQIISELDRCQVIFNQNVDRMLTQENMILKSKSKEKMLLEFRRYIEMLLNVGFILAVENVYDKKITAITPENVIFYLDRKYYSEIKLVTFMDIFRIETNDFKKIYWSNNDIPPHLGLILNYVENNYNGSYRFFKNRNVEYHVIYTILYQLNKEIKDLINILNSYHYSLDSKNLEMYECEFKLVKDKMQNIFKGIKEI